MSSVASRPHCETCSCRPPVPRTFVSDVRLLPYDLDRIARYSVGRGKERRVEEHVAFDLVCWEPGRRRTLRERVRYYQVLLDGGTCGNVREAVKMVAIRRREWHAKETERHARRLAGRARTTRRDGYERSLAYKKKLILAEGAPCAYCGLENPRTVDHIVPVTRGGSHRRRNLTPACWPCNQEKGARTPEEWREARLRAGLLWPPEQKNQDLRTFPGVLPLAKAALPQPAEEAAS